MARVLSPSELEAFGSQEWSDVAPRMSAEARDALERVLESLDGAVLSREQCLRLAHAEGHDLLGLLLAADALRRELVGNLVTYVVNRNINFTNICFVGCKFCAFSRGPRESDTYFLGLEQVARKALDAWQIGATEVCIQGGLPHGLPPFYYRDILRAVKTAVPGMHIHAFSPMEIVYGVELTGMPLEEYLQMLKENGLDTLPGTAAEILDDEVRFVLSRNKVSTEQWKQVIRAAHRGGIRTTSTMMYGHVETPAHWVNQLLLLRALQAETGGFTEFVPLGFVHPEHLALPARNRAPRPQLGRASQSSRARPRPFGRRDQQPSSILGQVESPFVPALPPRRCQRLRRHLDGREHLPRSRRHRWPIHHPGNFPGADPRSRPHSRRAQHALHPHHPQAAARALHRRARAGRGVRVSPFSHSGTRIR
jgi:CofH subfamily radical SAM domain protein